MIPLFKVHCPVGIGNIIEKIFERGIITEGEFSDKFESSIANFIGNPNACLVNSCTSALTIASRLIGLKRGDEVITSPMTCMATNEPFFNDGASLVFSDIDSTTGNIDPESVRKRITKKTKAIVAVHWGGQPFDIDAILSVAKENDIKVIEDAAHAFGAEYGGKRIGNHGDFVCFSFQAIKHLTTGDGGAILCKSKSDAERVRKIRWYGLDRKFKGSRWCQDISESGFKMHMNNIVASIGLEQMKYIDEIIGCHINNGIFYDKNINNCKIKKLRRDPKGRSVYWLYSLLVDDRQNFQEYMINNGVQVDVVHVRNDFYSVFKEFAREDLFSVKEFNDKIINIPVGWWLSEDDRGKILDLVNNY